MRNIFFFGLFLLVSSCATPTDSEEIEINVEKSSDSIQSEELIEIPLVLTPLDTMSTELINLLDAPLDIQAFKEAKRSANSGHYNKTEGFFKPDYEGFYIRYFIFPRFGESGPRIISYHKGEGFGRFSEKRDTLIQLFSNRSDRDLKNINIVGLDITEFKNRYGNEKWNEDDFFFFANENKLLTIKVSKKGIIIWFKWNWLDKTINSLSDIPESIRDLNAR